MTQVKCPAALALGCELRDARIAAGMTPAELAAAIQVGREYVHYLEHGYRTLSSTHLARTSGVLGISGVGYQRLMDLARQAGEADLIAVEPEHDAALAREYERLATTVLVWAPWELPVPLRTVDYTRAVLRGSTEDQLVAHLARVSTAPRGYTAILSEDVLCHPAVGRDQLDWLYHNTSTVSLRIVPRARCRVPAAFTCLTSARFPATIIAAHQHVHAYLTSKRVVTHYHDTVQQLLDHALSEDKSRELIAKNLVNA
ncbi:Scr1 family TA system antitoxin-like transcriptional regulator [Amycolatopsis samaneae]|uniref:Scr1 family TA system antitoxin-like transcriptional regulator n=1 Tax=Amycolatopsis samaneae TaxID=664691 RepID=A0ABW5GJB6_9PSEU